MQRNVIFTFNFLVWKSIPLPVMRNMVGYVIVAHKSDDQGKFYWNKKVEFELFIFRANQNIFQNQLEEE